MWPEVFSCSSSRSLCSVVWLEGNLGMPSSVSVLERTRPPKSHVPLPLCGMRGRRRQWLMPSAHLLCKLPVTDIHTPCACPVSESPLSFSPEFIEHCHCFLHAYLQVLLGLLEIQDSSLITSYLNVSGIHRKNRFQAGNQQLLLEAEIVVYRWPDSFFPGDWWGHVPSASSMPFLSSQPWHCHLRLPSSAGLT